MNHQQRVQQIAELVRRRSQEMSQGQGQGGFTGFTSWRKAAVSHMVPNPHDPRHKDRKIDVRDLNHLLEIDTAARTCTAESGLTFSDLVRATLKEGLIPMLVPELKTITIGGAVSGCSVESMSYKYGGFHDSCLEYEVVTGTGEVVRCSPQDRPELFDMLHGSYGTLGLLTQLKFRLIPAKPLVHMEYRKFSTLAAFQRAMLDQIGQIGQIGQIQARDAEPGAGSGVDFVDFIDGIIHGPGQDQFVLCLGRFVDMERDRGQAPHVSTYTWLDIFYKSTQTKQEDYLTTYEYLFRYDTECHWMTRTLPGLENRLVRLLVGKLLLGSTKLLTWSRRLRPLLKMQRRPPVVVDVFVPAPRMADFWDFYQREIDFYPLWVVPYRMPRPYGFLSQEHRAKANTDLFFDCAIYGKKNDVPGKNFYKVLEDKTYELGGLKALIAENFYDEETFWSIHNKAGYEAVKRQVDPQNLFRGLYEKTVFSKRR